MERIWYKNPSGFLTEHNFSKFLPTSEMKYAEQLNAVLRFTIYFSIVMFIIRKDANIFFLPMGTAVFTYFLYTVDTKNKTDYYRALDQIGVRSEKFNNNELCIKPTDDNPFMNVLMSDYVERPQREKACKYTKNVRKDIKNKFDKSLYRDVDDVFHTKASDRQFYTTPSTTIPNDSMSYARWLYQTNKTCKEGNGNQCVANTFRITNI